MLVRSRSASCASCWEVAVRSPIDVIWACVALAAPSALSADPLEIAATCCNDCASSARRCAWLRDTSAVALTRSPISSIPWCSSCRAPSASAATAPMSRTFASPDCIARAAASIPARRSETSSATSRADRPASPASARTSSATTANPSPCSSARAASIAALSASRWVWRAMRAIVCANTPIRSDIPDRPATVAAVARTSPPTPRRGWPARAPPSRPRSAAAPSRPAVPRIPLAPPRTGLAGRGAHGEEPLLRFSHHRARVANALNQGRRNLLQRHRDQREQSGFESGSGRQCRRAAVPRVVQLDGEEIGRRGHQDEEVADGAALVEGVGQHGDQEGRHEAPRPEPHHHHRHEQQVQQRQGVDEPPPVPTALLDHADERIEDRRPPRHEHHGGRAGVYVPGSPAEQTHAEAAPHPPPAPPQAPREGLEVLEALLQPLGFVLPAAQPEGERALGGGDGHVRPSSVTRTSTSTAYPARSRAARPPSSRSTTASTPSTRPPSLSTARIACSADPPVVMTSSTTTTAAPAAKQPSMRRAAPWALGCLRTVKASTVRPPARAAAAMA